MKYITDKQKAFCDCLLRGLTPKQAYRIACPDAGADASRTQPYEMLKSPLVQEYLVAERGVSGAAMDAFIAVQLQKIVRNRESSDLMKLNALKCLMKLSGTKKKKLPTNAQNISKANFELDEVNQEAREWTSKETEETLQ